MLCRPPKTATETEATGLPDDNDNALDKQFKAARDQWLSEVKIQINRFIAGEGTAGRSPILGTVRLVTQRYEGSLAAITLVSDGLENVAMEACVKPGHLPPYDVWVRQRESDWGTLRPVAGTGQPFTLFFVDIAGQLPNCKSGETGAWFYDYAKANGFSPTLQLINPLN